MVFLQHLSIRHIWLAGIVVNVLAAWFSVGYFHADEHFQLLEYASYKLHHGDPANLPWEYGAAMRPSFQVLVAYIVSWCLQFLDPFNIAFVLRLLSIVFALTAVYLAGKTVFQNPIHLKVYYLLALFTWFMPYQYARFSSENWSGFLMLFAVISVLRKQPLVYAGMLGGLSFCCRYQSAFFLAGLFLWLLVIRRIDIKQTFFFIGGFILVFLLGILTDYWLYGRWVLSSYQYFYINLVEGKAAEFGTEPFYYYLLKFLESGVAPIALLLMAAFFFYVFRQGRSVFTWVSLPFFVLHCLIAHKELRFLFPLVYFLPFFVVFAIERFSAMQKIPVTLKALMYTCIILNLAILPFSSFKASNPRISLLKHLYHQDQQPVCLNENPYFSQHWFTFYFPQNSNPKRLRVLTSVDSVSRGEILVVPSFKPISEHGQMIYRQVPPWLENLNYGHWLDRSNFWCITKKQ